MQKGGKKNNFSRSLICNMIQYRHVKLNTTLHLRFLMHARLPSSAFYKAKATVFNLYQRYWISLVFLLSLGLLTGQQAMGGNGFPVYKSIQNSVSFWEKVYGHYSSTHGILHDRDNVNIIYTVVDLVDWSKPGSASLNAKLIKIARKRYKTILADLAKGKKPLSKEGKRVASLFPHKRHTTYLKARDKIRLQIGQKDHFIQGVIRSGRYMQAIKRTLSAYGLPTALAYLPHVESSFNPKAYSKVGAAGLWQFTRGTGKEYMVINQNLDERYDPFLSTHAAAKLLKENFAQLHTWPLALTAYNYGRAGTVRAVRMKKNYSNIFKTYNKGHFKFASRNFYSEFIAALRVAKKLEKNPRIIRDRPEATITTRLRGYASSRELLSFFRVAANDFKRLNPALRESVLKDRKYIPKNYLLRLPSTKRIRGKIRTMGSSLYYQAQLPDTYHRVKRGETAGTIARRYRIKLKELRKANNLDKQATIRVGQKLAIPRARTSIIVLRDQAKKRPS